MRTIAMVLIAGMLALAPLPARAVEYKYTGEWLFGLGALNSGFITKRNGQRTQAATDDKFAATQRLRTWFTAAMSENLSGTINIELGDTVWGSARSYAGGGALGTDGSNVKLRQAYLDWFVPNTSLKFRMGIQDMALPNTAGGSPILASDGVPGIIANYRINDHVSITGMWMRAYNDIYDNGRGDVGTRDSYDLFMLSVPFERDGVKVVPWLAGGAVGQNVVKYGDYPRGLRGTDVYTNLMPHTLAWGEINGNVSNAPLNSRPYSGLFFAGLPISMVRDGWNYELDLNYGGFQGLGRYDINDFQSGRTVRADTRRQGWMVKGLVEYTFDWGTPGILGWYASGDDGNVRNGSERMPAIGPCNFFTSFIGDDWLAGVLMSGINQSYDLQLTYAGLWGAGVQVRDVTGPWDNLQHTLRVVYFGGTNSPSMIPYLSSLDSGESKVRYLTTKDYLVEFNLDSVLKLYDNFALVFELAYIFNGVDKGAWNRSYRGDSSFQTADGYKAAVIARYTF